MEIISKLIDEMDATFTMKNMYGANVLHIAVKGDQPAPLHYFLHSKSMEIDEPDQKGSTPLHWGCYSRSEYALNFLLAKRPNLDAQDNHGFTPLHLAVKSVEDST